MLRRSAFTILELLVVIGIIGVLLAIAIPAVQSVRESSKRTSCVYNLRHISQSIQLYTSSFRALPPGTLGFKEAFDFSSHWDNPSSAYFWKRAQHTSTLGVILPYIDEEAPQKLADPILFSGRFLDAPGESQNYEWVGDVSGFVELASRDIAIFQCPSDSINNMSEPNVFGGTQPVTDGGADSDGFAGVKLNELIGTKLVMTNYVGCSGAFSGGDHPDAERMMYIGMLGSRERKRSSDIKDGLSNSVLFGESAGWILDGKRIGGQSWLMGGLSRGRGDVPWMLAVDPNRPEIRLLGEATNAYAFGFGSMHQGVVNFAFGDGSTRSINRHVDWVTLYQITGVADGEGFATDF